MVDWLERGSADDWRGALGEGCGCGGGIGERKGGGIWGGAGGEGRGGRGKGGLFSATAVKPAPPGRSRASALRGPGGRGGTGEEGWTLLRHGCQASPLPGGVEPPHSGGREGGAGRERRGGLFSAAAVKPAPSRAVSSHRTPGAGGRGGTGGVRWTLLCRGCQASPLPGGVEPQHSGGGRAGRL